MTEQRVNLPPYVQLNDAFQTVINLTQVQAMATTFPINDDVVFVPGEEEEKHGGAIRFHMLGGAGVEAFYEDPIDAAKDKERLSELLQCNKVTHLADEVRRLRGLATAAEQGIVTATPTSLEGGNAPGLRIADDSRGPDNAA